MVLSKLRELAGGAKEERSGDPFVDALREVLSPDRVKYGGAHRALHSHDASVFDGGNSGPVVYPETTAEVQAVVVSARAKDAAASRRLNEGIRVLGFMRCLLGDPWGWWS